MVVVVKKRVKVFTAFGKIPSLACHLARNDSAERQARPYVVVVETENNFHNVRCTTAPEISTVERLPYKDGSSCHARLPSRP